MAGRMQWGFRHGLIWTTSAVTAIVAPHRNSHRRNGRVCMRRGASNSGWWIVVPGLLLAVLAAGACSSPERPAPAPEPDAGEPVTAPALRGAHESVDNPQETVHRRTRAPRRRPRHRLSGPHLPGFRGLSDGTGARRAAAGVHAGQSARRAGRFSRRPGRSGSRRRVLPLGRMVTVLQDAAGRAAAPTGRVRDGRFQNLRCQLRRGRGIAGVLRRIRHRVRPAVGRGLGCHQGVRHPEQHHRPRGARWPSASTASRFPGRTSSTARGS